MNVIVMKFVIVAACVAFAMAAPMPQVGQEDPAFTDVDYAGEAETQFDVVESGAPGGQESDPNLEQDPDYYYDSESEAADVGGFTDYTESDSNIGHRVARSPARPRGSGRFGPVRRRQFKLGGFRRPPSKREQ